jgi:hypothetical protein
MAVVARAVKNAKKIKILLGFYTLKVEEKLRMDNKLVLL